jgi:hypothetical protein
MGSGMKAGQRVKVEFEGILDEVYEGHVFVKNTTVGECYRSLVHPSQCTVLPDPEPDVAIADGKPWLRFTNGFYWCGDNAHDTYTWQELVDELGAVPAKAVPA